MKTKNVHEIFTEYSRNIHEYSEKNPMNKKDSTQNNILQVIIPFHFIF
jgi:hypothetical protein